MVVYGGYTSTYADDTDTYLGPDVVVSCTGRCDGEWNGGDETTSECTAACSWGNMTPGSGLPEAGYGHGIAYNYASDKALLFGGYTNAPAYTDKTWEWNGSAWTEKCTSCTSDSTKPTARRGHAMAYDAYRDKVILWGGLGSGGVTDDTWVWDGTNWTEMCDNSSNDPSCGNSFTGASAGGYDTLRRYVLVFGGGDGNDYTNLIMRWPAGGYDWDTCVSNGGCSWENACSGSCQNSDPQERGYSAMAYDRIKGKFVMFGGVSESDCDPTGETHLVCGDTWLFTHDSSAGSSTWSQKSPNTNPPRRYGHTMVWDERRQRVIMFGGYDDSSNMADVYQWVWSSDTDGDWEEICDGDAGGTCDTEPTDRRGHCATYNPVDGEMLMFGGYETSSGNNEIWSWSP